MASIGWVLVALAVLISGCGKHAVVQSQQPSDLTSDPQSGTSVSTSVSLVGDSAEDQLREANRQAMNGNFGAAITGYRSLADNELADPEIREEALYRLGTAYGHVLNGTRDYQSGVNTLERFLATYLDSRFAESAEATLVEYRKLASP